MAWYIDTSALVKLVSVEAETAALHEWVVDNQPELVASDLLRTELRRAVRRSGTAHPIDVDDGLAAVDLLPATAAVFDAAAELAPTDLRTLDSIHLATALGVLDDCDGIITYDDRLAHAARRHGLTVIAPR
jgi:predicted nucleic acid-binding protein